MFLLFSELDHRLRYVMSPGYGFCCYLILRLYCHQCHFDLIFSNYETNVLTFLGIDSDWEPIKESKDDQIVSVAEGHPVTIQFSVPFLVQHDIQSDSPSNYSVVTTREDKTGKAVVNLKWGVKSDTEKNCTVFTATLDELSTEECGNYFVSVTAEKQQHTHVLAIDVGECFFKCITCLLFRLFEKC